MAGFSNGPVTMAEAALRAFLARILGWADEKRADIAHALNAVRLSAAQCAALVLIGATDLVPVALALHRRALGADRPFVVCDPRRRGATSARGERDRALGEGAFRSALGGSLCLRYERLPADLSVMAALLRASESDVMLIVCADPACKLHPFLLRPPPIRVPALQERASEVPRIVDEYARDAFEEFSVNATELAPADREWILARSASSLPAIERGTRRLVAIRQTRSLNAAATRLGMTQTALSRWLKRRGGMSR